MVKRNISIICLFLLLIIAVSLSVSSSAMAYDPKNDLVSAMNLTATGPMSKNMLSELRTTKEDGLPRNVSIPISDGLSTYLDCSKPARHDLGSQAVTADFRTVIGFHFVLK